MTVISITITDATEQLVSGFPRTISFSANVPSTIFYTIDGSIPTTFSIVYVSAIIVPTDAQEFILKVFATNGVDSSSIITHTYETNILGNTRLPHSTLSPTSSNAPFSMFPFGSNSPPPVVDYLNNANAGITVDNTALPTINYGFDANGNPVGSNNQIDTYQNIYSTTDYKNETLPNVGNLPGTVTIIGRRNPSEYSVEESSRASNLFDARAMVIFQDSTTEDPSNPPQINPQSFSLENLEITKDGSALYATGLDTLTITGSYLRSHYNPRTQMVTNYYRDSSTNRWIISSSSYEPTIPDPGNLSGMVFSRNDQGVGRVYRWNQFLYRTLT